MEYGDHKPRPYAAEMTRLMRAVATLSALPRLWRKLDDEAVAESLAVALVRLFKADFVYVFLPTDPQVVELVCGSQGRVQAASIHAARTSLRSLSVGPPRQIQSVLTGIPVMALAISVRAKGEGMLVAASTRAAFPTAIDKLILRVAAKELAAAIERADGLAVAIDLTTLVNLSSKFIGIADLQGVPLFVNPAGLRLVGLANMREAQELHVVDFLEFGDRDRARCEVWPDVISRGRWSGRLSFLNGKTGKGTSLLVECCRIDGLSGDPVAIGTISVDIREWNQTDEASNTPLSEAKTRQFMQAVALVESLSNREHEVLLALSARSSHKTIALKLGISVRTVEVHRARMMRRLRVGTLAEAIRIAVISGAVE